MITRSKIFWAIAVSILLTLLISSGIFAFWQNSKTSTKDESTSEKILLQEIVKSQKQIKDLKKEIEEIKKNQLPKIPVKLFYYNIESDEDLCSKEAILPVEREIPDNENKITDTINLLLEGKLTTAEKSEGFQTEFPQPDFRLVSTNLDEKGTLTLEFDDPENFTSGGSCRVTILANQIIKTARQFPEVKAVEFKPETLFQP